MPWKESDAKRHTKKAKSKKRKHQWSTVANKVLRESGDEGKAVRIANSAVKKAGHKRKAKKRKRGAKR